MRSAVLLVLLGCSSTPATPTPDAGPVPLPWSRSTVPKLAQDDVLRVNHLQAKGTHNSYHMETAGNTLADWHYTLAPLDVQLGEQGVRQIELDVHMKTLDDDLEVFHIGALDEKTTCRLFRDCLRVIGAWSGAHPGHAPLYVQMEPKGGYTPDDPEGFFSKVEGEILSVLVKERIVTPDEVQGSGATLGETVAKVGWPTLAQTRGRIIFAWDDAGDVRNAYTRGRTSLKGRLVFTDSSPGDPIAAVAVLNDPIGGAAAIKAALAANMMVRTMADEPQDDDVTAQGLLKASLEVGATWISTNFPVPAPDRAYSVSIPGGAPLGCNPVTAPPSCTAKDIEDLAP